jgi:hypothetical protein
VTYATATARCGDGPQPRIRAAAERRAEGAGEMVTR